MKNVKMEFFAEKLKEMYPELTERQIKKTINIGCHNIFKILKAEENIEIDCGPNALRFVIHKFGEMPTIKEYDEEIPKKYIN